MQRKKLASYNGKQRLREGGVHQWNVCSKIFRHVSNADSFLGKSRLPSEEIHHDGECEASRMRIMT
jgi:hypothetical protein